MKKILVTTDLSANSKSGIKFAFQLAKQLKAELVILYVAETTKPTSWSDKHYLKFRKDTESRYLPKLQQLVTNTLGDSQKTRRISYRVEFGLSVPKAIIESAKKTKSSFICMSTRGAGKMKKLFGTNASSVLTSSPIPVIVVPNRYATLPIESIVFACDFARLSSEMKTVGGFADKIKAKVKVVHFDYLLDVPENLRRLTTRSEKLAGKKISFEFKKLNVENSLSTHLAGYIKKNKASIVVLFTKQDRNWFDRLLLPSQASEIAFNSRIPLLTFRKKV